MEPAELEASEIGIGLVALGLVYPGMRGSVLLGFGLGHLPALDPTPSLPL